MQAIERRNITGLVLAGGRGSRMGGVDKGLQPFNGRPLAAQVLERLAPQVGELLISANRNVEDYACLGARVVRDANSDFDGPLSGLLAGLECASTEWLLCVPCDTPWLPRNLALSLAEALTRLGGDAAFALDAGGRAQPLFALVRTRLRGALAQALAGGQRRVESWLLEQQARPVPFPDTESFHNLNTEQELQIASLQIRLMVEADLPTYKALRDAQLEQFPSAFTSDAQTERRREAGSYRARLTGGSQGSCLFTLVAMQGPLMLGALTCERELRAKARHTAHIAGMMVLAAAQGRGIGRTLMREALQRLQALPDLGLVTLSVTSDNHAALRLYGQFGFVNYGHLDDAIRMPDGRSLAKDLMFRKL